MMERRRADEREGEEGEQQQEDEDEDGDDGGVFLPVVSKKWSEEKERYDEITEFIREVDEILDFIKPFPRGRCPEVRQGGGRVLVRSASADTSDHLENLIKLVERLKDLKEKDSKSSERCQYLKDLKRLRERKKLLKYEAELESSLPTFWDERPAEAEEGEEDEEDGDADDRKGKCSLPFRKTNRGRSKSVNADEITRGFQRERFPSEGEQRRRNPSPKGADKGKVSKWTKVKEAFRWEKASVEDKPARYLQVPQDKTPESLSDSPLSGQVSGSSSVGAPSTICLAVSSGYSGEHSSEGHSTSSGYGIDLPPPPEDDFLSLPLLHDLSSSSSSEKLDELLTYSELVAKGSGESAAESFSVAFHHEEGDSEARRSKSLDGETVLGPSPSLVQHLSKECLTYGKTSKTHKTTWGKVKDIIQTRKDSLQRKPKKRANDKGGGEGAEEEETTTTADGGGSTKPRIELSPDATEDATGDSVAKRRLTPVLTITLPSTEELRSDAAGENGDAPPKLTSTPVEAKVGAEESEYFEDIPKYEKNKSGSCHKFSKWSKVKRAFLTSPSRSSDCIPEANSMPSSPNKPMSFFSDVESDELSSGEWAEEKTQGHVDGESPGAVSQDDLQKRLAEHHQKFDQKLREWERIKAAEGKGKQEVPLQKQKSEDWDKMPRSPTRQRDSMAIPLPRLDELSPEFKKKLDEWKKMKKTQTTKEEAQSQNFKMRIGEWQRWRPRHNKASEDFAKKLDEWQRRKGSVRRSRSQSERGKEESESPGLRRKNSKGTFKKASSSGKSSGTESLSGSLKEKDGRSGLRKQHKEKDLQWLEKELHKIERGKMRLEREREKFLEREARLEKMKRTMGTTSPTQEVLIKTPTGFFRFEGISQKFTKKLYEWEKAKGIAPEASTFALLEECARTRDDATSLQRSKSVGSVMEVSSAVQELPQHPSSLSLNDVDELDVGGALDESRESSVAAGRDEDEPQAIIVDVEDIVEETAAVMTDITPVARGEVPVYSYASTEVTQTVDSGVRFVPCTDNSAALVKRDFDDEGMGREAETKSDDAGRKLDDVHGPWTANEKADEANSQHSPEREGETPVTNQEKAVSRVREISSQLLTLAEKLEVALDGRKSRGGRRSTDGETGLEPGDLEGTAEEKSSSSSSQDLSQLITSKVLELKSGLNVLKTTADATKEEESPRTSISPRRSEGSSDEHEKRSPEMIKRKIREKISMMQRLTTETRPRSFRPHDESEEGAEEEERADIEEKVVVVRKNCKPGKQRKLLKTRRITDTTIAYKQVAEERKTEDEGDVFVEGTNAPFGSPVSTRVKRFTEGVAGWDGAPVSVFVPTTRKIISPVRRDSKGTTSSVLSYVIDDIAPGGESKAPVGGDTTERKDIGIPPLPNSPMTPRKVSQTAPSIRMMIAKYNQRMVQGAPPATTWRSPVLGRRFPEVQKSASAGLLRDGEEPKPPAPESPKGILKSSSLGAVQPEEQPTTASSLRALRIKKAKEEFLSRGPGGQSWTSDPPATPTTAEVDNRLSQSSCDEGFANLVKSASAGAINAENVSRTSSECPEEETTAEDDAAGTTNRAAAKTAAASLKFGISSIRSRFRKVRMKKAKEKESPKLGAVSTLCRQSLFLEIPNGSDRGVNSPPRATSKSCPSSPVLERSRGRTDDAKGWLRNPTRKMFAGKETKPEAP